MIEQLLQSHGITKELSGGKKRALVEAINDQLSGTSEMLEAAKADLVAAINAQETNVNGYANEIKQTFVDRYTAIGIPASASETLNELAAKINGLTNLPAEFLNMGVWRITHATPTLLSWHSASGTASSAVVAGGRYNNNSTITAATYRYNGASWSAAANLSASRYNHASVGAGENSALVYCGVLGSGSHPTSSELFNGTSWEAVANIPVARQQIGSAGTPGACLSIAGTMGASYYQNTYHFNGTSWTSGGNTIGLSYLVPSSGSASSAAIFPGRQNGGGLGSVSEKYNGTSWANDGTPPVVAHNGSGFGASADDAIVHTGNIQTMAINNSYRKKGASSFVATSSTGFKRAEHASAGASSKSGILIGGFLGDQGGNTVLTNAVELYQSF